MPFRRPLKEDEVVGVFGKPLGSGSWRLEAPQRRGLEALEKIDFERDQYWSRGERTWPLVGATVPLAVGRQASDLDRPVPSMSRGISAAHHRRWAAYAMSLGIRV